MINTLITNLRLIRVAKKMLKASGHNIPISIEVIPLHGIAYVKQTCYGDHSIPKKIGLSLHLLFCKWFSMALFHEVGHVLHPDGLSRSDRISELAAWEWCFKHGTHPLGCYSDVAGKALKAFLSYGKGVKECDQMMEDFVKVFIARRDNKVQ